MKRFVPKRVSAKQVEKPGELSLEGDDTATLRRLGINGKARPSGSNPYNLDPLAKKKKTEASPRTDLRELSQWIKLKREVEALKKEADPEDKAE